MELKRLDLKKANFTADGKNFTILPAIPLSRYKVYRKLYPRLAYGMDVATLFKNCKKGYDFCNKAEPEPVSAGIVFHNIMNGLQDVMDDSREEAALLICTLIIAEDGEDIGTYDEALGIKKIQAWAKEGYDGDGFFHLALLSMEGFKKTYEEFTSQKK